MRKIVLVGNPVMARAEDMTGIAVYPSLDAAQQSVNEAMLHGACCGEGTDATFYESPRYIEVEEDERDIAEWMELYRKIAPRYSELSRKLAEL